MAKMWVSRRAESSTKFQDHIHHNVSGLTSFGEVSTLPLLYTCFH